MHQGLEKKMEPTLVVISGFHQVRRLHQEVILLSMQKTKLKLLHSMKPHWKLAQKIMALQDCARIITKIIMQHSFMIRMVTI
jgi:hypothetical protein